MKRRLACCQITPINSPGAAQRNREANADTLQSQRFVCSEHLSTPTVCLFWTPFNTNGFICFEHPSAPNSLFVLNTLQHQRFVCFEHPSTPTVCLFWTPFSPSSLFVLNTLQHQRFVCFEHPSTPTVCFEHPSVPTVCLFWTPFNTNGLFVLGRDVCELHCCLCVLSVVFQVLGRFQDVFLLFYLFVCGVSCAQMSFWCFLTLRKKKSFSFFLLLLFCLFFVLVVCTMFDFCLYQDIRVRRRERLKKKAVFCCCGVIHLNTLGMAWYIMQLYSDTCIP